MGAPPTDQPARPPGVVDPPGGDLAGLADLPQANTREYLRTRLFLRAALPTVKVLLEDDPATKKRFANVVAVVQFVARNQPHAVGAYIRFDRGEATVVQGMAQAHGLRPDVTLSFGSLARLNDFFAGKTVLPGIKGLNDPLLVARVVGLLLGLKLMMPTAQPKDAAKRALKIKLTLYMITTALSQYNKGGDAKMTRWTAKQPDRVYQFSVEPEGIAAYLRVRGGQTKAGRGLYQRRRPFVHMRFHGVDGALAVMNKDVEFVEGVGKGFVRIDGSPEYAANLSDFMMRVQALLTG
jgi:hypothetical protein